MNHSAEQKPDENIQAGFSLLEALVATAITALAIIPLLSLQQANLSLATSAQSRSAQVGLNESTLAVFRSLDIASTRDGVFEIGRFEVRWTAKELGSTAIAAGRSGEPGRFSAQLFEVLVTVHDSTSGETRKFTFDKVGFTALRDPVQLGLPSTQ